VLSAKAYAMHAPQIVKPSDAESVVISVLVHDLIGGGQAGLAMSQKGRECITLLGGVAAGGCVYRKPHPF
jgi:hypothetical protein